MKFWGRVGGYCTVNFVVVLNVCYFDPKREMIQFDDHICSTGLVQPPTTETMLNIDFRVHLVVTSSLLMIHVYYIWAVRIVIFANEQPA